MTEWKRKREKYRDKEGEKERVKKERGKERKKEGGYKKRGKEEIKRKRGIVIEWNRDKWWEKERQGER